MPRPIGNASQQQRVRLTVAERRYKEFVVAGAEFHGLPDRYVEQLRAVEAVADPDPGRRLAARGIMENGSQES